MGLIFSETCIATFASFLLLSLPYSAVSLTQYTVLTCVSDECQSSLVKEAVMYSMNLLQTKGSVVWIVDSTNPVD